MRKLALHRLPRSSALSKVRSRIIFLMRGGPAEEKGAEKGRLRDEVEARVVRRQWEAQRSQTALENPGQVGAIAPWHQTCR